MSEFFSKIRELDFPEESLMPCSLSLKQVMSSSCRSAGLAMVVNVNSIFNGWLNFFVWGKDLKMFQTRVDFFFKQNVCQKKLD